MNNTNMRTHMMLIESALTESAVDHLQQFLASPAGELIGYTFSEVTSPVELQHAIIGTAEEVYNNAKAGNWQSAKDHGIANAADLDSFIKFAQEVAASPKEYFDAHQQLQTPRLEAPMQESDESDLEAEMPYLDGEEKEEAESKLIDLETQDRQYPGM